MCNNYKQFTRGKIRIVEHVSSPGKLLGAVFALTSNKFLPNFQTLEFCQYGSLLYFNLNTMLRWNQLIYVAVWERKTVYRLVLVRQMVGSGGSATYDSLLQCFQPIVLSWSSRNRAKHSKVGGEGYLWSLRLFKREMRTSAVKDARRSSIELGLHRYLLHIYLPEVHARAIKACQRFLPFSPEHFWDGAHAGVGGAEVEVEH